MISIIIVNWNAGFQLSQAIASIALYHFELVQNVIIVDNGSSDDSLAQIDGLLDLPFQLRIIRNRENRGFAAACNQGAALADTDYLLFLNPDTFLKPNSLPVPLDFMRKPENAHIGIVGIQLLDEKNQVSRSCARFPSLKMFIFSSLGLNRLPVLQHLSQSMVEWDHASTRQVDQVIGAFFFVRRSLFLSLGGFDERFFVYFEEVDFSFHARQLGYLSVYLTEAQAFHVGGGTSRQVKSHRLFYSLRSRMLYGFKHFKPWKAWALVLVTLGLEPLTRMVLALIMGTSEDVRNTMNAYRMLYCDMRDILRKAMRP